MTFESATKTTHRPPRKARPVRASTDRSVRTRTSAFAPRAAVVLLAALALAPLGGCELLGGAAGAGTATSLTPSADADQVAFKIREREISVAELEQFMTNQFMAELRRQSPDRIFELRERAAREWVQKQVVDAEAAARGIAPDQVPDAITQDVPRPTAEEVALWYSQNQARLNGRPLETLAGQIENHLTEQRKAEAWQAFLAPKIEALAFEMKLEPPRAALLATRLIRGKADAPITITAFSDYQCPYCIQSEPVLAEVLERYPEQVRLIHRHFPLDGVHPFARIASEAAMCADEQGRFWDFHDAIFARQGRLEDASWNEIAGELGLDLERLETCIDERRYEEFVTADYEAGVEAGVTGTPAFFVNGIALKGARDADEISRVVDSELARLSAR